MELLASLFRLQQNGTLCDVRLKSADKSHIMVHSVVLAAASTRLCEKLSLKKCRTQTIKTEIPGDSLVHLVKFIYTGHGDKLAEIEGAAKEIGVDLTRLHASVSEVEQTKKEPDDDLNHYDDTTESNICKDHIKKESESHISDSESGICQEESHSHMSESAEQETNIDLLDIKVESELDCGTFFAPDQSPEHSDDIDSDYQPPNSNIDGDLDDKAKMTYTCTLCDQTFKGLGFLERHSKIKHGIVVETNRLVCNVCKKVCQSVTARKVHEKTHDPSLKPFECNMCGKAFRSPSGLRKHKRKEHIKKVVREKPYRCEQCDITFKVLNKLLDHERIHTGEKPFVCDICGTCCRTRNILASHQRTHNDEKPFQCSQCDKCFKHKHGLEIHERNHTGERPFMCKYCGRGFTNKSQMVKHERKHAGIKPFSCDKCDMKFSDRYYLVKHAAIHSGLKPISCDVCDYVCRRKCELKDHYLKHTGERPYKCNPCNKAYNSRSAWRFHMRSHNKHNNKPNVSSRAISQSFNADEFLCQ